LDHPFIAQWLKQHGHLISKLTVEVHVSEDRLKLRDFCQAAAACRSIDLEISHLSYQVVDLADLAPVAGCLQSLLCQPEGWANGSVRGASAFSSMLQLTKLEFYREDLRSEEPWGMLANLTSLQQLRLEVCASGDPSPMSALTGLTHLDVKSVEGDNPAPFNFSSLQPLSTLQQLEELHLAEYVCTATSLQGLAGLSSLKLLHLDFVDCAGWLDHDDIFKDLRGISPAVVDVSIANAPDLVSLVGMEGCQSLEKLFLESCGVSSLQPLRGCSSLKELVVSGCSLTSLEGIKDMPLESLCLSNCSSLTELVGVEHLSSLKSLVVRFCGVTSLQPLSQLGQGLQELCIFECRGVREEVLELPHVQPSADVLVRCSHVEEVVLAGGVIMACKDREGSSMDSRLG
jgi:hypothetical protein